MTERRGDQGFSVAPQSISGGRRRRSPVPQRIGVVIVVVASLALITIGFVGPRLSGPPNFDIGYFATPTPRETPSATPTPTATRPGETPFVTPLPTLSRPADAPRLDGELILTSTSIQRLDLATGELETLLPMTPWQDGVLRLGDHRVACFCIESGYDERGANRTVRLTTIDTRTGATVRSALATYPSSPEASVDQADPLFDVAVDRAATHGLLVVGTRTAIDWRMSIRGFDPQVGEPGPDVPLGAIPVPQFPASASPSPTPQPGEPPTQQVWLDGPHIRLSPDGRTAVVYGVAQRYSDFVDPVTTSGAWRVRVGTNGSIEDVAAFADMAKLPQYCFGMAFAGNDRFTAVCAESDPSSPNGTRFSAKVFDGDGRLTRAIDIPPADQYGYLEPLVDDANGRLFLWDPLGLKIVRIDVDDGAVAAAKFDPAANEAAGVARDDARRLPSWRDTDSSLQLSPIDQVVGAGDGTRLYATGFQERQQTDFYGQKSLGVFVIDPRTLALVQHWAPIANDVSVGVLADGRVAVGGQPGVNAAGDQVPWQGSLTIREAADGTVVARYGQIGPDMTPTLLRP
jgi:hypothetical protein